MPILPKRTKPNWIAKSTKDDPTRKYKSQDYNSVRWRKARAQQLGKQPLCEECLKNDIITSANVCDHINPVRLGGSFWDSSNHQSMCTPCHNKKSGAEAKLYKR